jgi:hypothetical protein
MSQDVHPNWWQPFWTITDYLVGFEVLMAVSMKMAVFWVVVLCSLVEVYRRFRGTCRLHHQGDSSPWWWRQQVPLKHRWTSTRLHSTTTQKTAIFTDYVNCTMSSFFPPVCWMYCALQCNLLLQFVQCTVLYLLTSYHRHVQLVHSATPWQCQLFLKTQPLPGPLIKSPYPHNHLESNSCLYDIYDWEWPQE